MSGSKFWRADLHVHSLPDDGSAADPPEEYLRVAAERDVRVLALTDHNRVDRVDEFLEVGLGTPVLVLPGIEVSTYTGHLLAIFGPAQVEELRDFASKSNLSLRESADGEERSTRSTLDLVEAAHERGGLAILAHVDANGGLVEQIRPAELQELLASPSLAGIEFRDAKNLHWFSPSDDDPGRRAAWTARCQDAELRFRGLARITSSDAHNAEDVGKDRPKRTLTRLKLDEPTWPAVRTAILYNSNSRCKPEPPLPLSYPAISAARFTGGFLDGVSLTLSPNLNCVIGGRGSGKSTALVAIRAALGATDFAAHENPDDPDRMPERTEVDYVDEMGSVTTVVRELGHSPRVEGSETSTYLRLADVGQEEAGSIAESYEGSPRKLLEFLDSFMDLEGLESNLEVCVANLRDNAGELLATLPNRGRLSELRGEEKALDQKLERAKKGKIEAVAKYAQILSAEAALLAELRDQLQGALESTVVEIDIDIDSLAAKHHVDLNEMPAADFVPGDDGLRNRLASLRIQAEEATRSGREIVEGSHRRALEAVDDWVAKHETWSQIMAERKAALREQGLEAQAGEAERISLRLAEVRREIRKHEEREARFKAVWKARQDLLGELARIRSRRYFTRKNRAEKLSTQASGPATGFGISIFYRESALLDHWTEWLRESSLNFRSPRLDRLAAAVSPVDFADLVMRGDEDGFLKIEHSGERFFTEDDANLAAAMDLRSDLEAMLELQVLDVADRPVIEVTREGDRRAFDRLSVGQKRSVLLALLLSTNRSEPLIIDQPEDHLDAAFIADSVVEHFARVKESRQIIIATHNANLTVLGDAELVVPLVVERGRGVVSEEGGVDRSDTKRMVCQILEGGEHAYRRRGERYGMRVRVDA